jgi:hypothetical protein
LIEVILLRLGGACPHSGITVELKHAVVLLVV